MAAPPVPGTPTPPPSGSVALDPVRDTYRYVRIILVALTLMLLIATFVDAARHGWRPSISDYYAGPVRDVFVGCLMAVGACLVAFKGSSKLEDYALNFAGLNAFIVALVPNNFPDLLAHVRDLEKNASLPDTDVLASSTDLVGDLKSLLVALFVASLIYTIFDATVMHWTSFDWSAEPRLTKGLVVTTFILETLLLAVAFWFVVLGHEGDVGPVSIFTVLHFGAAALLIANLGFTIASYAWPGTLLKAATWGAPPTPAYRRTYRILFVLMPVGIVALAALGGDFRVLLIEYFAIGVFLLFWVIETRRSWHFAETA